MLAAYYTRLMHKVHKYPFLKSFVHSIILFNLGVMTLLTIRYFEENLTGYSPSSVILNRYSMGLKLLGFLTFIGMVYTLVKVVEELQKKTISSGFKLGFVAGIMTFSFSYGIGISAYIQEGKYTWFNNTEHCMLLSGVLVIIVSLIMLLVNGKKIQDINSRKIIHGFGFLYLSGFTPILITLMFAFHSDMFIISVLFLLLNLFPFVWFKLFFLRYYGEPLPLAGNRVVLDRISAKYCISEREREIFELVLQGRSNKEIERLLFISIHTVKNHIYSLYKKLNVKSRFELMNFFLETKNSN